MNNPKNTLEFWKSEIQKATQEPDPVLSNLKITRCHYLLSQALQEVLGIDAGANFHSWAVWGSRKAGVTIRQEDLGQAQKDGRNMGALVGALVGFVFAYLLAFNLHWMFYLLAILLGIVCGGLVGKALIIRSRKISAQLILEGNKTVLEDIGMQTAHFLFLFQNQNNIPDEKSFDEFLSQFREGKTEEGGQDLLKKAFTYYWKAYSSQEPQIKQESSYAANCLAVYHEHIRLEPYIKGSMPYIIRRCVTKRLLQFDIGPVKLSVAHDVPLLNDFNFPESLKILKDAELCDFLKNLTGEEVENISVNSKSAAKDWTKIRERMRYVVRLFRILHLESRVLESPYEASHLKNISLGIY